jgi:hypothetical protein
VENGAKLPSLKTEFRSHHAEEKLTTAILETSVCRAITALNRERLPVILKRRNAMIGISKRALILATLAIVIPQSASAAVPNAKLWNGSWHLNASKSKFSSSTKEQSETRTYRIAGGKVTVKSSSKDPAGKTLNFSYSAGLDGKSYPMTGNPNADSISINAVSAREIKARSRLHGKLTVQSTATVSPDGKHLTIGRKMLRIKGAPTDVLEFDR